MPAYDKVYLADAVENLGEMAFCATACLGFDLDVFWTAFVVSDCARAFASGAPSVVGGLSGAELALRVCEETGLIISGGLSAAENAIRTSSLAYGVTCEYWCGWAVAYYQWASARSFRQIWDSVPMSRVERMYPTFHEESEDRFAEAMESLVVAAERNSPTKLQTQRKLVGLSQSQLARATGVGLRAIQQYEQRAKDINKASVASVVALSRALFCQPEDILEPASHIDYALVEF